MVRAATLLQCTICDRTFTRREHLLRHARSHTREKPYQCPTCAKSFTRFDTLTRHMASHEQFDAPSRPLVSTRACTQCAKSRVRCSHSLPCERCANKQLSCTYPASASGTISSTPEVEVDVNVDVMDLDHLANQNDDTGLLVQGVNLLDDTPAFADFSQRVLSMNWWSPGWQEVEGWETQQPSLFALQPSIDNEVNQLRNVPSNPYMGSNAVDTWHSSLVQDVSATEQPISNFNSNHNGPSTSSPRVPRYYVDGGGVRAPLPGRYSKERSLDGDRMSVNGRTCTGHSNGGSDSPSQSVDSIAADQGYLSNEGYLNLCGQLRSRMPTESLQTNQDSIPTVTQFRRYLQHYFEEFHPSLPFLHKASFRSTPIHWVLVLAVAIVGSQYAKDRTHTALHGLLASTLREYSLASLWTEDAGQPSCDIDEDESSHNRLQLLQAAILNTLLMLLSGSQVRLERIPLEMTYLVATGEDLDLFNSEPINHETPANVEEWIYAESKLRTAFTIWSLDTISSNLVDRPFRVTFMNPMTRMPCPQDVWESISNQLNSLYGLSRPTFMDALEMLYMEKKLPTVDEFCAILLIQGIHRKSRDVLTQSQSQLHDWIPHAFPQARKPNQVVRDTWPPSSLLYMKWRNSACDCLDILHWSANSNIAKSAGWEDPVVLHLHLARILLLTPVAHLQTLAADPLISRARVSGASEASMQSRWIPTQGLLGQWVSRDQYKARLSLVHAGAIFWHVRRYSVNSIVEPFAIYAATLILWAYSIVARTTSTLHSNDAHQPSEVHLDSPEADESQETDYEPLIIYIDRPCDDEMVQKYARVGPKMTASMRRIGSITASGAPKRILLEGIRLLKGETQVSEPRQALSQAWGVSQLYAESLARLEALGPPTSI